MLPRPQGFNEALNTSFRVLPVRSVLCASFLQSPILGMIETLGTGFKTRPAPVIYALILG